MNADAKHQTGHAPAAFVPSSGSAMRAPAEPAELDDARALYRSLSTSAVVSLVFGLLSWLSALHWAWGILPLLGTVAALWAWRRISRTPEELSGLALAKTGLGLSLGLWAAGSLTYYFFVRSDVPCGYEQITFEQLQPDPDQPGQSIAPLAVDLEEKGTKVFIRGYMYPGRQTTGIKRFVLVPMLAHCSFCMTRLKSTEMIRVELTGDLTARYEPTMVGVGGLLEVDPAAAATPYGGFPYQLKADCITN